MPPRDGGGAACAAAEGGVLGQGSYLVWSQLQAFVATRKGQHALTRSFNIASHNLGSCSAPCMLLRPCSHMQECDIHIAQQLQQLADSQTPDPVLFLEQVDTLKVPEQSSRNDANNYFERILCGCRKYQEFSASVP